MFICVQFLHILPFFSFAIIYLVAYRHHFQFFYFSTTSFSNLISQFLQEILLPTFNRENTKKTNLLCLINIANHRVVKSDVLLK